MKNVLFHAVPLTDDEKALIHVRLAADGEVKVASEIGIARATLGRQLAGLRAHKASTIATRVYLLRYA